MLFTPRICSYSTSKSKSLQIFWIFTAKFCNMVEAVPLEFELYFRVVILSVKIFILDPLWCCECSFKAK